MMICPNCRSTVVEGAAFCSSCVSPMPQEEPAASETTPTADPAATPEAAPAAEPAAPETAPAAEPATPEVAAAPVPPESEYQQAYEQPDANQAAYQQFDQTAYQQYGQAGYQQAGADPSQQPNYQQPMYEQPIATPPAEKSKVAAGLLGIFLGALGIHKFYLGYTKAGVIMLLVSLLTFGIGAIVMDIIGIVEGILYLTKSDWEFYNTYVAGEKDWF